MEWPSENIRRFKTGQIVVNEGDIGREMYIVLSGLLHVVKRGTAGEKVLSILNRGDFFGEMAILEDLPRSANVVAVQDSELLEINAAKADEMLARQPEIAMRMLKKMSERLREADRQIETLLHNSDPSRIVHTISSLVYLHGRQLDGQWVLDRVWTRCSCPPWPGSVSRRRRGHEGSHQEPGGFLGGLHGHSQPGEPGQFPAIPEMAQHGVCALKPHTG